MYVQSRISDIGTSESSMLRDEFILESGRLTFDSRSLYKLQITSPEDMSLCFLFGRLANHSGLTSIIVWCKYDKIFLCSICFLDGHLPPGYLIQIGSSSFLIFLQVSVFVVFSYWYANPNYQLVKRNSATDLMSNPVAQHQPIRPPQWTKGFWLSFARSKQISRVLK
ncbi:uncharacterized protein BT62DRAFT_553420 [Guyanagaster necrorhizus]|uniref:Uncharacterized protein n=1 Tax=Guyanagaster necrorhizus TaxID=856835 RepID=A0A9P8ANT7_9AGAR|nr:uncharacterized protein BT62DRAFT_553420 [Guyanagaster necrorhizus MCA 3950]KAG7441187.1 hypothetical protein BT62DRAFT_553420 [Guyanagaster necrorhizus MCA 3950]